MDESRKIRYIRFAVTYNIVLLIPLLVISLSVLSLFFEQQHQKLDDEMQIVLERQNDFWSQQMSVIHAFNTFCKYDKKYNELYSDVPMVYFDIWEELGKQEKNFPFADGIYLYDKKNEIVLTSGGNMTPELFFSEICIMDISALDTDDVDKDIYAYRAFLRTDSRPGLVLAAPLQVWGEAGREVKYLLYTVKSGKLASQFEEDEKEAVILFRDEVVYSTGNWNMQEDWNDRNQLMQTCGDYYIYRIDLGNGFETINYVPKSSIAKSMKIYIQGYGLWLLCSVVLGLGLAVMASRKPYKMFQELTDHNVQLMEERDSLRMEGCLYELLSKEMVQYDSLWQKCVNSRIYVDRKYKFFVVLPEDGAKNQKLYDWLEWKRNPYGITSAYRIEVVEGLLIYLVCSDEAASALKGKLSELVCQGAEAGVGDLVKDVRRLRHSYKEAQKRMNACWEEEKYPEREILSLKEAVEDGDFSREQLLLEIIRNLIKEMNDMTATAILWDVARIYQMDTARVLEIPREENANLADFVREFLLRIKERIPEEQPPEEKITGYKKKNIMDILEYIKAHYLDDNFSVKYMASCFETSVSNISHFFKKNTGVTISQYVEQIKLEKAKELLENSDKKVAEIAQMLRYNNSTVFIEMFKRYEGVTPGGYRENIWGNRK